MSLSCIEGKNKKRTESPDKMQKVPVQIVQQGILKVYNVVMFSIYQYPQLNKGLEQSHHLHMNVAISSIIKGDDIVTQ